MTASLVAERGSAETHAPAKQPAVHTQPSRNATIRVLHVINGEHYSGAERVQDLLAGALPEFGFEVGLACVKPGWFLAARKCREAPLYCVPMRSRFDFRAVGHLVRIIRREGYQLLHAHTPRTLLIAVLASLVAGVPVVYHVHSPTSRDSARPWQNRVNAVIEWVCMWMASALLAVSGSLGEHLRRLGFGKRRVSVVRNGVPGPSCVLGARRPTLRVSACRPHSPGHSARPQPRGTTNREWVLGTLALFRPRKGLDVLLDALAKLRREGLPVRLRAVGGFETPEYERQIKTLADQLGLVDAVEWIGFADDVDREFARMDLFVLPSLFGEGLPMVVLEAMAAGVPVVATRVEGVPEAIRDGRDGLLAEPGDPFSLARAIGRVVRGEVDWTALRTSGLRRHADAFSDRSMAAGVAEVYGRVLGVR
jgi:glycosyltransferase involved in cell wall biosynthesis